MERWVFEAGDLPANALLGGASGPPAWAAATHYIVNQTVTVGADTYVCIGDHTSGGSFVVGTSWRALSVASFVHAATLGVTGDGSAGDETRIRAAIATGKSLYFPPPQTDYVIASGSLTVSTPGQFIFCPVGRWRATGRPWPLFDVLTSADGVKLWLDHLFYDQSIAASWLFADDASARNVRGGRLNGQVAGIYSAAQYQDLRANMIEGFYAAVGLSNWNTGNNSKDASSVYRQNNYVRFGFKNVFVGLGCWGQQGLRGYIAGSYQQQGAAGQRDDNPPHAIYISTENPSKDCGIDGYCYDSSGTGHIFDITRVLAVSGGNVLVTVTVNGGSGQTATVPATASAATVKPLIEALSNVGAGNVSVYDLPDSLDGGTGWRLAFDHSLGSLTPATGVSVNSAGVTPNGGGSFQSVELQPFNSGAPWRIRSLTGGVFGALESNNTPGSMELTAESTNITIGTVRSASANPSTGGACTMAGTNCVIKRYREDLAADGRVINLGGTDNRILSAAISAVSPTRVTTDPYVVIRGARNEINIERLVNSGVGGRYAVQVWNPSDSQIVRIQRMSGILEQAVSLFSGVTNSLMDVDSRFLSMSAAGVAPLLPWLDNSGNNTNSAGRSSLRRRLPGMMIPQVQGWAGVSQGANANRAYFLRCYLDEWMLIKTLILTFTGTLAGTEKWDLGIFDQTGAPIWTLGATLIGSGTGAKQVSVPAAFQYYPANTLLYIGYWNDTAIGLNMANWATAVNMTNALSASLPVAEDLFTTSAGSLPASMSGVVSGAGAVPIIAVKNN